jgi:predicted  nucleic acid-binding Zn-ribbon protein
VAIDAELLKAERERLKGTLRELETEQRKLDGQIRKLRQQEIRTKREIEALTTLLDMQQPDTEVDKIGD